MFMSDDKSQAPGGEAVQAAAAAKRKKGLMTAGVAVGVGSAALVAALLYANRSKRDSD
jgi:Tfp pilus assembly protein PilN